MTFRKSKHPFIGNILLVSNQRALLPTRAVWSLLTLFLLDYVVNGANITADMSSAGSKIKSDKETFIMASSGDKTAIYDNRINSSYENNGTKKNLKYTNNPVAYVQLKQTSKNNKSRRGPNITGNALFFDYDLPMERKGDVEVVSEPNSSTETGKTAEENPASIPSDLLQEMFSMVAVKRDGGQNSNTMNTGNKNSDMPKKIKHVFKVTKDLIKPNVRVKPVKPNTLVSKRSSQGRTRAVSIREPAKTMAAESKVSAKKYAKFKQNSLMRNKEKTVYYNGKNEPSFSGSSYAGSLSRNIEVYSAEMDVEKTPGKFKKRNAAPESANIAISVDETSGSAHANINHGENNSHFNNNQISDSDVISDGSLSPRTSDTHGSQLHPIEGSGKHGIRKHDEISIIKIASKKPDAIFLEDPAQPRRSDPNAINEASHGVSDAGVYDSKYNEDIPSGKFDTVIMILDGFTYSFAKAAYTHG